MNDGNNYVPYVPIDWEKWERGLEMWRVYKDDIKALERIVRRRTHSKKK